MTSSNIYEMEPVQVSILRKMASGMFETFVLIAPNEASDSLCHRDWALAQDLLRLGLVEDIQEHLSKAQREKVLKTVPEGRTYVVLAITQAGQLMFEYCDDPDCTVHKLGDPMRRRPC